MNLNSILTPTLIAHAMLFVGAGAMIGAMHFTFLRWNAQLFISSGPVWHAVALQLARMMVTSAALLGCAYAGALPLVAALAGLLLARQFTLRKARAA
jgi:F1F0 ATPase subunit 2